ncbi:recombinase family protein, partial [Escherichia coli]|nr:recombinase family protein [Escherichia coli]
ETEVVKSRGGIPFTYGPLAYILKSRIYAGEIGHSGKWFDGEHEAIIDPATFEQVQAQLATNGVERKFRRSESGALLMSKLY